MAAFAVLMLTRWEDDVVEGAVLVGFEEVTGGEFGVDVVCDGVVSDGVVPGGGVSGGGVSAGVVGGSMVMVVVVVVVVPDS